jgi:hypothetical protein
MTRLLARLALAAPALMLGLAGANANVLVTIEQNGFGSGPIKVISEDGKKWTKILDGEMTMPVSIYLGISSGYLTSYKVKQIATTIYQTGEWIDGPISYQDTLELTGSTANFAIETQTIIGACNSFLNVGQGIHEKHTAWHGVQLELVGYFLTTNNEEYPPYSGYGEVSVPVECLPYQSASNNIAPNGVNDPLLIKEAKLFLTTYSNGQNTGMTLGGCPMLKTTVRFETNKAGPVSFELNRFPGGMTSHTVNAELEPGSGKFYARYQKSESFQSTTSLQYMAQSTSPSAGNTGWKDITIHCGGGLAPDTGSADPHDGLPSAPQLKGDFSFLADNGTSCPRKVKALINFTSSVKDNVHYSLDCTNGHFSGVAQTAPKPSGGYVAPALVTFDVTETTQANCALKSVAPGKPKVHTLKGHHYQCVDRAVDPASGDVTTTPKPGQGSTAPAGSVSVKPGKVKDDAKAKLKADRDAAAKLKADRDAAAKLKLKRDAAKLKAAAEAERRRKSAEKAAADKAKKDLAEKLKRLKAKKTSAQRNNGPDGQSNVMRLR